MKLQVKDMDISTGGIQIAIVNYQDASDHDFHALDRVKLKKGKKSVVAVLDIGHSDKAVPRGSIGLFEETLAALKAYNGDKIELLYEEKPESTKHIKKKLDGRELNSKEIRHILDDIVSNKLTDVELTYYVAANYTRGMSEKETVALTKAMINTGDRLEIPGRVVDKHCIGGVAGNRTTMVVVPILIAAGVKVPKTSSRAITSPAGTADTMEVLANVNLSIKQIYLMIKKVGGCMMWGGAVNLAPADDTIINVEHPMSIDSEGQLISSILAKKGSVSSTHVLIDIPIGRGAKIDNRKKAEKLANVFIKIGKKIGMKIKCIITDGSQPIGNGIGPALEARDVLWLFENDARAPKDLRKKSLMMAGLMLEMAGKTKRGKGLELAKEILSSGKAHKAMIDVIRAQGAKHVNASSVPIGHLKYEYCAVKNGRIRHIDNKSIAKITRSAGSPLDKEAGIYLHKHVGDKVVKGDQIMTIYAGSEDKLKSAIQTLKDRNGVEITS